MTNEECSCLSKEYSADRVQITSLHYDFTLSFHLVEITAAALLLCVRMRVAASWVTSPLSH